MLSSSFYEMMSRERNFEHTLNVSQLGMVVLVVAVVVRVSEQGQTVKGKVVIATRRALVPPPVASSTHALLSTSSQLQ